MSNRCSLLLALCGLALSCSSGTSDAASIDAISDFHDADTGSDIFDIFHELLPADLSVETNDAVGETAEPELVQPVCLVPQAGMGITQDVTLCPGVYELPDLAGTGALVVAADNVTVACDNTVITSGQSPEAYPAVKSRGFSIIGRSGVHITGCTVRDYHFGIYAADSSELTLSINNLSGNFHDPSLGWVFDTVTGGGIQLVRVSKGALLNNDLSQNFNGLEMRSCTQVEALGNDASHTSNAGVMLLASHECTIANNDLSWAIRGTGVSFPDRWYGWETADSAAILLDAGSSANSITGNVLTHSGRGAYVRSVLGGCPQYNNFDGNDASYAAHAAMECWCDHNSFVDNTASNSQFGFLLSGSDNAVVSQNQAAGNLLDGIAVQSGEGRHLMVSENLLEGNGRAGLLLSGVSYPDDIALDSPYPGLSNVSHILAQANRFSSNEFADVFLASVRGVHLLSNCTLSGKPPLVKQGDDVSDLFTAGSCGTADQETSVAAVLSLTGGQVGEDIPVDASASSTDSGQAMDYYWLAQALTESFPDQEMPQPFLSGTGGAATTVQLASPGIHSVSLTVHDSVRGALATAPIYAAPEGEELSEFAAANWANGCSGGTETSQIDDPEVVAVGQVSMQTHTGCPYSFWIEFPQVEGGYSLSPTSTVHMFVRVNNPNPNGWQGNYPLMQFRDSAGKKRFVNPTWNMLASAQDQWIYVVAPVGGGSGWAVDDKGADLADIQRIFIQMDTHDWGAYTVWVDGVVIIP